MEPSAQPAVFKNHDSGIDADSYSARAGSAILKNIATMSIWIILLGFIYGQS